MLKFLHIFTVLAALTVPAAAAPDGEAARLGEAWAALKYHAGKDPERLAKVRALKEEAAHLSAQYPDAAGLFYWRAQILSLEAEILHSNASLDCMDEARDMLVAAERLDPGSSAPKSLLGSIYYEMPGWPISYGNSKKAGEYLRQALDLDPDGMDPNYFMGDFQLHGGHAAAAMPYLEKAAQAAETLPPSAVVEGRRKEIAEAIAKAHKGLKK